MPNRDRKDLSHDGHAPPPHDETPQERADRKRKESDALDEALQETFPTSDPVSPFVPAIRTTGERHDENQAAERRCAHERCDCRVEPPQQWCSEACREAQQGFVEAGGATCACGHADCAGSASRDATRQ
jgi:hypothetical protein